MLVHCSLTLSSICPTTKIAIFTKFCHNNELFPHRLIELGKLRASAREKEKRTPLSMFARKSKNRVGILETKFSSCRDCGEEFCASETCGIFSYDSYERISNITTATELAEHNDAIGDEPNKRKRLKKRKSFKKRKSGAKSQKKPASRSRPQAPPKSSTDTKKSQVPKSKLKPVVANKIRRTLPSKKQLKGPKAKLGTISKNMVLGKKAETVSKKAGKGKAKKMTKSGSSN